MSESSGLTQGSTYRSADAWAWAHEDPATDAPLATDPAHVVAVMVVHNAEEWLPRQLLSLAALDPRPGEILVVDNGSTDGSQALLERALREGVISSLATGTATQGFGAAVAQALAERSTPRWLWLLHDDSAPKKSALRALLVGARAEGADVLVPKLLMPKRRNYPDQLLEVGRSIGPDGRQAISVDPGDIDQHQLDSTPVLGGSTAGMLIRGSVWKELDGLDPAITLYRDGVDLGWRASERGHKVVTCPQAALYHRQSGRLGWRSSELAPRADVADRVAAYRMLLARAEKPRTTMLALWFVGVLRAIGWVLGKSLGQGRDEISALREVRRTPGVTQALRERLEASRPENPVATDALRPHRFDSARHGLDRAAAAVVERFRDLVQTESDMSIDELTGGDFAGGHRRARRIVSPLAALSATLIIVGIVAGRAWLMPGTLIGGSLLAAPATLADAWSAFLTPTAGVPGSSPLWLGFMALGSTLAFGQPGWFVLVLLLGAPLFAAWSVNSLLRLWIDENWLRAILAGLWASGMLVFGFVQSGSLAGITFAIAGPMFARSIVRWTRRESSGAARWRGPAATAGWLTLLSAAYPVMWLLAVPAGVWWIVRDRVRWPEVAVALVGPMVFLAGWVPALVSHPGRLLTGADPLAAIAYTVGPMLALGNVNAGFMGVIPAAVLFAVVIASSGWMLIRRLPVRPAWWTIGVVAGSWVMVAGLSRAIVGVNGGWARPDVGPWLLLAFAGMLAPLAIAHVSEPGERPEWLHVAATAGAVVPLVFAVIVGTGSVVQRSDSQLPSYVTAVQDSFRHTRTVMVTMNAGSASWAVVSAEQPMWGTAERDPISSGGNLSTSLRAIAQAVASGNVSDDIVASLHNAGVGHIWVEGANPEQVAAISNASGLTRAAADDRTQVWTVTGLVSRAQLWSGSTVTPLATDEVPSGADGRRIVLSEPTDSRWRVRVNGSELAAASPSTHETEFIMPAEGGTVTVAMAPDTAYAVVQGLVALVLIVLAAPVVGSGSAARRGWEER